MSKPRFLEASRFYPAATLAHSQWSRVAVLAACVCMLMASMIRLTPARAAELLSPPQMEQLVAPVALYPDSLLSQVLMASTYPLEVVEAQRWRAAQPRNMSDQQISVGVQNKPWDPSVKSLTAFPDVLQMMSDRIDWTQQMGDAFLGQQQDMMDAVQHLRARAQATGHLNSGSQQTVVVNRQGPPVIQIVSANPEVIYVPVYNPLIVYGPWPYAAYQPFYWYPPAYRPAPGVFISFGFGLFAGHALWGHVDWRQRAVTINVNRYNSFNNTHVIDNRWVHNVEHRRGVEYRNPEVRQRYDQGNRSPAVRDAQRQPFRNQAETGRAQLNRPSDRQAAQRAVQTEQLRTAPAEQRGPGARAPNAGAPNVRVPRGRGEGSAPQTGTRQPNAIDSSRPDAPPRNESPQRSINRANETQRPAAQRDMQQRPAVQQRETPRPAIQPRDMPQRPAVQQRETPRPAIQPREMPQRPAVQQREAPRPATQPREVPRPAPAAQSREAQQRPEAKGSERRGNRDERKSD
ncbi:MAG: DUF3300 domain-containing protein [Burkholderiaceae bacterium]